MDGVPQIFAFSMVRGVPEGRAAIVRVGLPKAWVLVEVNRISKRNVALTVLVILLALILTRVFSEQSLLRPIESLVNATNRLAGGDLGVRTGLPYRAGELGQLAESFDAMADALQTEEAERMRAQQALRTSEARYRSVAQSAKNGIIIADSKGNIVAWNEGAQETFGYAEEEVLGKPLTLLMPTRYHEAHRRGLEQFRSTGESRVIGAV
ncbi:MAG: PAS domain S-box protein, partial [Deltaproteobacteria bacterium]|nr:PAS domain S-box protein [Deltaproteobacteria bacterium]